MVVGFDAAEPHIVLDLAAKGDLPHVQSLVDRGVRAEIVNPPGFFVSASWPSMFTGLSPAHHGRFSGLQLHPGTYAFDRLPSQERNPQRRVPRSSRLAGERSSCRD